MKVPFFSWKREGKKKKGPSKFTKNPNPGGSTAVLITRDQKSSKSKNRLKRATEWRGGGESSRYAGQEERKKGTAGGGQQAFAKFHKKGGHKNTGERKSKVSCQIVKKRSS